MVAWVRAWYFLFFSANACLFPFFNLILHRRGISEGQIGIVSALCPIVSLVAGIVFSGWADRQRCHRNILLVCLVLGSIGRCSIFWIYSFVPILVALVVSEGFMSPVTIVVDAAAMAIAENGGAEVSYGKLRQWGAIGWGLMSAVSGFAMAQFAEAASFILFTALSAMTFAPSMNIPWLPLHSKLLSKIDKHSKHHNFAENIPLVGNDQPQVRSGDLRSRERDVESSTQPYNTINQMNSNNNVKIVAELEMTDQETKCDWINSIDISKANATQKNFEDMEQIETSDENLLHVPKFSDRVLLLIRNLEVMIFFSQATIMGFAVGTIEGFLFIALEDLGGTSTLMGLSLTFTCISETLVFYFSNEIIQLLGLRRCFHVCFLAFLVRLVAYTTMSWWKTVWLVLPVELLHGITFGLTWVSGTTKCASVAPPGLEALTQAVFQGLLFGLGRACGGLAAGYVYENHGHQAPFIVAAFVILVGWAVTTILQYVLVHERKPKISIIA